MAEIGRNTLGVRAAFNSGGRKIAFFSLPKLEAQGFSQVTRFPVSIRILLENLLRREDGRLVTVGDIRSLLSYPLPSSAPAVDIPFLPVRVLLQDFTGVPAVVDFAAMRDVVGRLGGDPGRINPLVRADLVIDHSIQVDSYGVPGALAFNEGKEYERNGERYGLLHWAQTAFSNFMVVPPGKGICHQVNLEYLAPVVDLTSTESGPVAFPDTLVGTDSHTTMINGLGVLGWGVGGIEAEAVMLGQPYFFPIPEVVGVRLRGELSPGVTATDLVLTVTELLRNRKVVDKFVEFCGPGLASLSLPDRATIANMAPEYGATVGFFPVDARTLDYLRATGRDEAGVQLVETYCKEQGLFWTESAVEPLFSEVLDLDLSAVAPSLAGPKRPQDRVSLKALPKSFRETLKKERVQWGFGLTDEECRERVTFRWGDAEVEFSHGSVVIAAITSCTNTSNPSVTMAAGLLAKKALERGILSKPWVKTSLAPGSRVVTDYLAESGLLAALEAQGFYLAGYGCTTCIGNSGPLPDAVRQAIEKGKLVAGAVLSGNRNFEGRIHGTVRASYLASPPLVVAYALAGTLTIDFDREPLGIDRNGTPVFLREIWPTDREVAAMVEAYLKKESFVERYRDIYEGGPTWDELPVPKGSIYTWDPRSTYIRRPPFFDDFTHETPAAADIVEARTLLLLGDSVTTDHISPAGAIPAESPAGRYLMSLGVSPEDFNSYGSRRGNHEVMMRGTFANIRIRNRLLNGVAGGFTRHFPSGEQMTVWDAACRYRSEGRPLIVLAGREYGTGSSRDWAAKGTCLLGVRAVIAESFERIHRGNLIGMGVLPLQFPQGVSVASLGLTGEEAYTIAGLDEQLAAGREITVESVPADGRGKSFQVLSRLDTHIELEYHRQGGILNKVLRHLIALQ